MGNRSINTNVFLSYLNTYKYFCQAKPANAQIHSDCSWFHTPQNLQQLDLRYAFCTQAFSHRNVNYLQIFKISYLKHAISINCINRFLFFLYLIDIQIHKYNPQISSSNVRLKFVRIGNLPTYVSYKHCLRGLFGHCNCTVSNRTYPVFRIRLVSCETRSDFYNFFIILTPVFGLWHL